MTMRVQAHVLSILAMLVLLAAGPVFATPSVIGEDLRPVLNDASGDEMLPVVVLLAEHDKQELAAMVRGLRAEEKKAVVWQEVRVRADRAQAPVLDRINRYQRAGDAGNVRSLKLANAISLSATSTVVRELSSLRGVRAIHYTPERQLIPDTPDSPPAGADELDEIAYGVDLVNAPDVWDMGYTGEGVLVAVIDTGVNYNHQDLNDHLWDGGADYPNHGWDFYNNDSDPMDDNSHGTHCAGTVCGDGTAGSQTGVAPDATLMCLKVLSSGGGGTEPIIWESLDFVLAQGVDVTSMSLGFVDIADNLRSTFRSQYDLLNVAGIVNIVAAGNEGDWQFWYPIPDNVRSPANVPAPWTHPDQTEPGDVSGVITAGASDINDNLAAFSSRGPVTWETVSPFFDYEYNGGASQGLIKPDLSAPGVDVKSLTHNNNSGYVWNGWSGTSMATPHIAGAACLLFEMNENLTPAEMAEALMLGSVDYGTPGKDNNWGAGRLDAHQSLLLAEAMGSDINVTVDPLYPEPYFIPGSGGTLVFDVTISNNYAVPTPGNIWTDVILPNGNTYHIQTYNPTFQPGNTISVSGVQQNVPGSAPDGTYQFNVKAGTFPGTIVDMDSFEFFKMTWTADGEGEAGDWATRGLEAVEETATVAAGVPSEFGLRGAYPNPFNPSTTVTLALPQAGEVEVAVYNALGRQVATLASGRQAAGLHQFTFNAESLASGVYFISARAGAEKDLQKVVLMK